MQISTLIKFYGMVTRTITKHPFLTICFKNYPIQMLDNSGKATYKAALLKAE